MGRPKKTTADWIPLDVNDGKTFFVLTKNWGNDGFTFWVQLLRLLGRSEGLYFRLDETTKDYLFASVGVNEGICYDIINTLVNMGNIDRELWEKERLIWCQGLADRLEVLFEKTNRASPTKPAIIGSFVQQNPSEVIVLSDKTPSEEEFCQTKPEKQDEKSELCPGKVHKISKDNINKINITKEKEIKPTEENKKQNARDARAADEPPLFVENDLSGDVLAVTTSSPNKLPKDSADFNATAQNGAGGGESTPKATNAHSVKNSAVSAASQKPTRHKYGEYGWVLLTDAEYGRAVAEYGEDTVTRYIAVVDEYVEGNGNKNGYKNWNTVLRKAIRQKWGNQNHAQTRGSRYGPQEVDKGRISNTLVEALKEVELETKKEAV